MAVEMPTLAPGRGRDLARGRELVCRGRELACRGGSGRERVRRSGSERELASSRELARDRGEERDGLYLVSRLDRELRRDSVGTPNMLACGEEIARVGGVIESTTTR